MRTSSCDGVARARKLRRSLSPPEAMLWTALRARPGGLKFRRQHPYGRYTLDFFCVAAALCVEVDGDAHDMGSNPDRDATRDEWLRRHGIETMRVNVGEVFRNLEGVVAGVVDRCIARCPSTTLRAIPLLCNSRGGQS